LVRKKVRAGPKVYRVYTYGGNNYIKLGGKAWRVFSKFYRQKHVARARLESLKWASAGRFGPGSLMRVVRTNYGWAVVTLSSVPKYQPSASILKTER